MIFSSYGFILAFLPITLLGYYILQRYCSDAVTKLWLVAASLAFYGLGNVRYVPILCFTVLFNYFVGSGMQKCGERKLLRVALLTAGMTENLGLLFYFKYTNFFLENVNRAAGTDFPMLKLILPLGISFYTFQIIAYLVDTYREETEPCNLLDYMVFATFFPQLTVGPVIRYDERIEQLRSPDLHRIDTRNIMCGIMLFSIGCAKKVLLADFMIAHAQNFYNVMGNGDFFQAWGAVFSYTFAYYFDFSGYIDMALGLGLFFNIKLPINFNSPYKARNFADFWRRWNITISMFFNDYIFRSIFKFGNRIGKLILATMVTFLVSGVWHGAGWHFILWGLVNGVFVCFANIMTLKRKKLPAFLAWALTFFFILVTRVLFDANNMSQVVNVYKSMFDLRPAFADFGQFLGLGKAYVGENLEVVLLMLAGAVICFFFKNSNEIVDKLEPRWYHAVFCGILLTVSLVCMTHVSQFLYFQF
ncbi:MAG TPA: MBOAT family O-acyltransferase [Bacillota bacterium]|nr:MBOAT family O-acyltransferase [Bacillota bacterium]